MVWINILMIIIVLNLYNVILIDIWPMVYKLMNVEKLPEKKLLVKLLKKTFNI